MEGRKRSRKTDDAVKILNRRYTKGQKRRLKSLAKEEQNARIAEQIYSLRQTAGLTQKELAKRVGTTPSVICRLEDADYDGYTLKMLQRISAALQSKVEIRFVPAL